MPQLNELDELIVAYIESSYLPELHPILADSFTLLDRFSVPYYEDRFISLLTQPDTLTKEDTGDLFIVNLRALLLGVLEGHAVTLDADAEPNLAELNELLFFLLLVQDLEDTTQLSYRLNGSGSDKMKFIDLLVFYSRLEALRAMELIEGIGEGLILSMKMLIADKDLLTPLDQVHRSHWNTFLNFTEKTECLGHTLNTQGFFGLNVTELLALSAVGLPTHLEKVSKISGVQAALDLLSVLMLCKDSYQTPLLFLENHTNILVPDIETATKLKLMMMSILTDLNSAKVAAKQGDSYGN